VIFDTLEEAHIYEQPATEVTRSMQEAVAVGLLCSGISFGWIPHNANFGFLDLTPSILLLRQFWD
jgi:hypothetical protein